MPLPSQLNVDIVSPENYPMIEVNGLQIIKTNSTVYLGSSVNIPISNQSVIIGQGAAGGLTGPDNVAIGRLAMWQATASNASVAIGSSAGGSLTTGISNTFIGCQSGGAVVTGFANTCVGQLAGATLSGNALTNTFIGNQTGTNVLNITGEGNTCLGNAANPSSASVNHEFTLGSSSITALRCAVTSITSLSDARDKKNIEESKYGLDLIESLKPVTFEWETRDGAKKDIKDLGFIAQDLKKIDDDYLGLVYDENPEKLEASYGRLIPVLVKAIQELSEEVKQLKK